MSVEGTLATGLEGWEELVMGGYGFTGDKEYAKMQFETENAGHADKKVMPFLSAKASLLPAH